MAERETQGEQLSLFDAPGAVSPRPPARADVAAGSQSATHAGPGEAIESGFDEAGAPAETLAPVFVAEVALLPAAPAIGDRAPARTSPRWIRAKGIAAKLIARIGAAWRRWPTRARWGALCGGALLSVAIAWIASGGRRVEPRETAAVPPKSAAYVQAAAALAHPPVLRASAEGSNVRVALVGARGRYAHVVAIDSGGRVLRLYPFEAGESVRVDSDDWLPGTVELAEPEAYRLYAFVTDAPIAWTALATQLAGQPLDRAPPYASHETAVVAGTLARSP